MTAPAYDLVLRWGAVFDGSGSNAREADVAVDGDRIVAVARAIAGSGRLEIDCRGLAVMPGLINPLSWAAETLFADGRSLSDLRQGVTLEVFGEGDSLGPLNDEMREAMGSARYLSRSDVTWSTLAGGLDELARRGVSTNIASFVGATTVRLIELGQADRAPTTVELHRMRRRVREAMADGALGVGSSLIYAPAHFARIQELVALAAEAARAGGIYASHMRSEGEALLEGLDEFLAIVRRARVPGEIYHLKAAGAMNWGRLRPAVARIEAERARGARITANMYPYTAGAVGLDASLPPWAQEGGLDRFLARLEEPGARERMIREMRGPGDGWENLLHLSGGADRVRLVGFRAEALRRFTGASLAAVARALGRSPEDAAIDLLIANGGRVDAIYHNQSGVNVAAVARIGWVSFGSDEASYAAERPFLDRLPHPRAYGTFARVLGRFVREQRLLSFAEAVRRMTTLPAATLGLAGRGRIAPGYCADLVILDPAAVADHATYDHPHSYASGVHHVFVNGVHTIQDGIHTGAQAGRVVRGQGARRGPQVNRPRS